MIALSARKLQTPTRPTAAERNRLFRAIKTQLRRLNRPFRGRDFAMTLALAAKNRIQLSTEKQEQTG